ncbi:MAG: carbon-nitrogen hydrolase [Rubrobacteraceae bacterium]|nr:carbon-nitrogen hydrolase [Rubrobacteraceae bacterium]MCL6649621.1 carbon-nitrogen hydrolase [Chloroflexota bacterium]
MKALLAQLEPQPDPELNAARARDVISAAGDAEIAIFPELFLGGYATRDLDTRVLAADDELLGRIGVACARSATAAVIGFTERLADGACANSVACFDTDGELVAVYRKTHLFGAEAEAFRAGDELRLVTLAGVRCGILICFDIEFPEPARQLARAGAELLVTASANMAPYEEDHRLASRARALDNRLPHVYVNRVGEESSFRFVGRSRVVGPDGEVLAELSDSEEVLAVDVPLRERPQDEVDYLRQVRPELPVNARNDKEEAS